MSTPTLPKELTDIRKTLSSLKTTATGAVVMKIYLHGKVIESIGGSIEDFISVLQELFASATSTGHTAGKEEALNMTLYRVVYGNYSPAEVDSIWRSEADADKRAEKLGGMWKVEPFTVSPSETITGDSSTVAPGKVPPPSTEDSTNRKENI